jgi:hypothetical protein
LEQCGGEVLKILLQLDKRMLNVHEADKVLSKGRFRISVVNFSGFAVTLLVRFCVRCRLTATFAKALPKYYVKAMLIFILRVTFSFHFFCNFSFGLS